jgi:hypothetical protein
MAPAEILQQSFDAGSKQFRKAFEVNPQVQGMTISPMGTELSSLLTKTRKEYYIPAIG